jgi:hypothetical protein
LKAVETAAWKVEGTVYETAAVKAKKWVDYLVESLDALMAEELVVELEILKAVMKEIG